MSFSKQIITFVKFILFLILCLLLGLTKHQVTSLGNSASLKIRSSSVCESTPYPDVCLESLAASHDNNMKKTDDISLIFLQQSLKVAILEGVKLSKLLSNINLIEKHNGGIQDCIQLHQLTLDCLKESLAADDNDDARSYLTAAVTNKNTCLEGLESASGPLKSLLVDSIIAAYKHVSNCLSLLPARQVKLTTMTTKDEDDDMFDITKAESYNNIQITVATDGTGNFRTITDAINFAPNNSVARIIIYIKPGTYYENVEIPSYKPNIALLGEDSNYTFIVGNRSVGDGWTTFRSATVAVSGKWFFARNITFENIAGPQKHQAVALLVNAEYAAFYRCVMIGHQDTLYVHNFKQFYRECAIFGTIDYIFGNAAAVFQRCNIGSRTPMPGQFTVVSAQSRDSPDQDTGISFQNCVIGSTVELAMSRSTQNIKSYLGRPWRPYSRTVVIESYIGDLIDPAGWISWSGGGDDDQGGLDTLYYGEFQNVGPGSSVDGRVTWPGHHIMDYDEASNFTVSRFIEGQEWLNSTGVPYDDWI